MLEDIEGHINLFGTEAPQLLNKTRVLSFDNLLSRKQVEALYYEFNIDLKQFNFIMKQDFFLSSAESSYLSSEKIMLFNLLYSNSPLAQKTDLLFEIITDDGSELIQNKSPRLLLVLERLFSIPTVLLSNIEKREF